MRIEPVTVHNSFDQVYVRCLVAIPLLTFAMDLEVRWSKHFIKMPHGLAPGPNGHCASNVKRIR